MFLYEGITLQTNAHNKSTRADFISRDQSHINCYGIQHLFKT